MKGADAALIGMEEEEEGTTKSQTFILLEFSAVHQRVHGTDPAAKRPGRIWPSGRSVQPVGRGAWRVLLDV